MEKIGEIPVVVSKGSSYEIGYHHGKTFPERVQRSYECNLKTFYDLGQVKKEEIYRIAAGYIKPVEQYNKDYIEEI